MTDFAAELENLCQFLRSAGVQPERAEQIVANAIAALHEQKASHEVQSSQNFLEELRQEHRQIILDVGRTMMTFRTEANGFQATFVIGNRRSQWMIGLAIALLTALLAMTAYLAFWPGHDDGVPCARQIVSAAIPPR